MPFFALEFYSDMELYFIDFISILRLIYHSHVVYSLQILHNFACNVTFGLFQLQQHHHLLKPQQVSIPAYLL